MTMLLAEDHTLRTTGKYSLWQLFCDTLLPKSLRVHDISSLCTLAPEIPGITAFFS